MSRRNFLAGGVAALGLGTTQAAPRAGAGAAKSRIDVHHHYLPPVHRETLLKNRGGAGLPDWSVQMSLDDMDKAGIATAVISSVQPGVWFGDNEAGPQARARGQRLRRPAWWRDHPGRFGLFAAIPLPDPEGSLKEIAYAFDTLKADGIGLFTSYKDKYLGDPAFVPVFEELNRRKAVVYVHPVTPDCCRALVKGIPPGTIEYATDTTRTITSLIFGEAGSAFRFPDIRWIWSHSGGTLPFLTGRLIRLASERKDRAHARRPAADPAEISLRGRAGKHARPARGADEAGDGVAGAVRHRLSLSPRHGGGRRACADYKFSDADARAIDHDNAMKLLPNIKTG